MALLFERVYLPNNVELIVEFAKTHRFAKTPPGTDKLKIEGPGDPFASLSMPQRQTAEVYIMGCMNFLVRYQSLFGPVFETNLVEDGEPLKVKLIRKGGPGELNTYRVSRRPLRLVGDDDATVPDLIHDGYFPLATTRMRTAAQRRPATRELAALLAMKSVELVLPAVRPARPEDILETREKLRDHLPPFWASMLRLSTELSKRIDQDGHMADIGREATELAETIVRPAAIELQSKMEKERKHWFYKILGPAQQAIKLLAGRPHLTQQELLTGALMLETDVVANLDHMRPMPSLGLDTGLTYLLELDRIVHSLAGKTEPKGVGSAVRRAAPRAPQWKKNIMNNAVDQEGTMASPVPQRYDVVILCAIRTPELEKVFATGEEANWRSLPALESDPSTYHENLYVTAKGKRLRIVAAAPTQMGMPASAVLATKMILRFRPRLVAMVGIAAGAKSDKQEYGSILAPNRTFDYNAGKLTVRDDKLHFEPDFDPVRVSERLRGRLEAWSSQRIGLDAISQAWPVVKQRTRLAIHVGPMGSGAQVIDAKKPVLEVLEHWRKLVGIEMEAYGVHLACANAISPPPEFLCMKSICDFGAGKTDEWQDYAAFTAAQLCHRFLTQEWENLFPEGD